MYEKRKILIAITAIILLESSAFAEAQEVEAYFLSRPTSAFFIKKKLPKLQGYFSENLGMNDCIPMGEGCFHPQYGYISENSKVDIGKGKYTNENREKVEVKNIHAQEVNLINCDKESYFDLYCGKAEKIKKSQDGNNELELWLDTSSSMRLVDYSSEDGYCDRRRLISSLKSHCKSEVKINLFNTTKKRLSTLDNLCINHGTNDGESIVKWLKLSQAKRVVIITDMEEYVGAFREYLDSIGAKVYGIGIKPFKASDLIGIEKRYIRYCQ